MKNGIDVSVHQGDIDWKTVRNSGITFAIIRAGFGREISQKDSQFEANYNGCKANNIPCGAYWYNYAKTPEDAEKEADTCLKIINGKKFEYPIYYDVEEQTVLNLGKARVSAIIRAFLKKVEAAGYFVGLYMAASHLNSYVEDDIKNRYAVWVAHINTNKPSYSGSYGMWQYSWKGRINGISGDVDTDYAYVDYPTIIKNAGLNGYKKPENPAPAPVQEKPAPQTGELSLNGKKYKVTFEEI